MLTKQKIEINTSFEIEQDIKALSNKEQSLIHAAKEAAQMAYAPYSNFKVGAAVLLENGEIVKGNNQENAAYPNGMCAERVALFNASSNFPDEAIIGLALTIDYADKNIKEPVFPCGGCRQTILEYEDKWKQAFKIYVLGPNNEIVIIDSIKDILPLSFSGAFLTHLK